MEDRPITSQGYYDMSFIDWQNEFERIAEENPELLEHSDDDYNYYDKERYKKIIREIRPLKMKMGESKQPCIICMCKFDKGVKIYRLTCKHLFHVDCLDGWIKKKNSCPMCRDPLIEE